ncbi:hypothetical protein ACSDQ9_10190 [Aestuariimicrobium soli]|uniref:hypothetical protein n=1 Tax=Aestuariimicrobium soli TaxID=2035834 RepID=UPI003EBC61F7
MSGTLRSDQGATFEQQIAWLQALRPRIGQVEFVFNRADDEGHRLTSRLARLTSTRTVGVTDTFGYGRPRPTAVRLRFGYDREVVRAIEELGGFFTDESTADQWTGLGDVDVVFRDAEGRVLGATIAHERLLLSPDGEPILPEPTN